MGRRVPAKVLRVHICESDRHGASKLYEAIVAKCRERGIAGATVFRGLEGFGESAELHRAHLLRRDQPMIVTIVDSAEKLAALQPEIEAMLDTGAITSADAEMIRVQNNSGE